MSAVTLPSPSIAADSHELVDSEVDGVERHVCDPFVNRDRSNASRRAGRSEEGTAR
jgi:hypothetical protein